MHRPRNLLQLQNQPDERAQRELKMKIIRTEAKTVAIIALTPVHVSK